MINKNDFVEIEFTGRISDTKEIFDTNIEKDAKEAKFDLKGLKPFTLSIGHKMLPEGLDEDLIGKEVGKKLKVEISPEKAFGKRDSKMVRMIPTKLFHQQEINPQKGMQLSLDGQIVKILSNSGGRTLVDFNNPLAGKNITYDYTILRKIDDQKEKVNGLQDFLFRKRFNFEEKDKKIIFKVEKRFEPFIKLFSKKFEEILGLGVDCEIIKEEKKESKNIESKNEQDHEHEGHDHHDHSHAGHSH